MFALYLFPAAFSQGSFLCTTDSSVFIKCNNACSAEWKPHQRDSLSPGPPSWEGMISPRDPEVLGHVCLLCAAQGSFSLTCVRNVPKLCPEAFHGLLLTQVLHLLAWAKFTRLHSYFPVTHFDICLHVHLSKMRAQNREGAGEGGHAGKSPVLEPEGLGPGPFPGLILRNNSGSLR